MLEYVTRLARGPNIFVIKLLDSSLKEMRMLKPEHISREANFWEMTLDNHEAYARVTFV